MGQKLVKDVFIVHAVRTPIGKIGGALAGIRPDDLAAHAVRSVVARQNSLDPVKTIAMSLAWHRC